MANPTFAMTLFGVLLASALVPTSAATETTDLVHIPPGTVVRAETLVAGTLTIEGVLLLDGPATVVADRLVVAPGGLVTTVGGLAGHHDSGVDARGADGVDAPDARIVVDVLHVAAGGALLGGPGGDGGSARALATALGGDGGDGASWTLDARVAEIEGAVLGGAGGRGGDAIVRGIGVGQATGGSGGDSGSVRLNDEPFVAAASLAPAIPGASPAIPCPNIVPECSVTDVDACQTAARLARNSPLDCDKPLPDINGVVDVLRPCLEFLGDTRSSGNPNLIATSAAVAPCKGLDGSRDKAYAVVEQVLGTEPDCRGSLLVKMVLVPWETCEEIPGMVRGDAGGVGPGEPGAPGTTEYECNHQGKAGTTDATGSGGRGGDACVIIRGTDGEAGKPGNDGVIGCSAGGNGGSGGNAGAAVATAGAGGHGQKNGGPGGSAIAGSHGGDGGAGGRGGTRWGDPDCAGGAGGVAGNGADATATAGAGGHGLCGAGGPGGEAQATSTGGSGGRGGAGTPSGATPPGGAAGTAQATPGAGGLGTETCLAQ